MKVIFLDVDGVLNCQKDYDVVCDGAKVDRLSLSKVSILNDLIAETEAKVVLSSTWRKFEGARRFLSEHVDFIDCTPILDKKRGDDIQHWLDAHPEVTDWVIVDDDGDMLPSQMSRFVQTTFETGLEATHAYRMKWILENGPKW